MADRYTIPEANLTVEISGDDQSGYEWSLLDGVVVLCTSQHRNAGGTCQSRGQALQAAFGFAVVCL